MDIAGRGRSPAEQREQEFAEVAAGSRPACGYSCPCHGNIVCLRAEHPDVEHNRVPHMGKNDDGTVTMWTGPCPPDITDAAGNPTTAEALAQAIVEQKQAAAAEFLEHTDLETLVAKLGPLLETRSRLAAIRNGTIGG